MSPHKTEVREKVSRLKDKATEIQHGLEQLSRGEGLTGSELAQYRNLTQEDKKRLLQIRLTLLLKHQKSINEVDAELKKIRDAAPDIHLNVEDR